MEFTFKQATRADAKARIALVGPSGAGKTFTALGIASGLGDNIAVIDTEHGSAAKYAHKWQFSTLELESFDPRLYVKAIEAAEQAGFDVIVIDSLSHAWEGKDGALEQIDKQKGAVGGNQWAAWSKVTPMHRELIEAIVGSECHVVATMRTKTAYEVTEGSSKKVPQKIGLAPVQRDGMEYEFDVVGTIDLDHCMEITKTRYEELDGKRINFPGADVGRMLRGILCGNGQDATAFAPATVPATAPQTPAEPDPATQTAGPTDEQKATFAALLEKTAGFGRSKTVTETYGCASVTSKRCERFDDLTTAEAEKVIASLQGAVDRWAREATEAEQQPQEEPAQTPVPDGVDPDTGEIVDRGAYPEPSPEPVAAGASDEGSLSF